MLGLALVLALLQEPRAAAGFDPAHLAWDTLLREFVHEDGLVDYRGLAARRAELDAYLAALQAVKTEEFAGFSAEQREAFWINAYNAWAVALILDNPQAASIRDLGGLFSSVFDKRFVPLQHLGGADKPLSLGELEHAVLGKTARRPTFHFAIVCASRSCPELRAEAFVADRLDAQLAEQARRFLADPAKNDVTIADGRLRVSKIFDWSEDELERYPGGIRAILRDFGPDAVAQHPALATVRLKYRDYDWSLNAWLPKAETDSTPAQ
jgi:hypothetical protein